VRGQIVGVDADVVAGAFMGAGSTFPPTNSSAMAAR
jgi:hypothetical protein